jgi:hypothetical protein
MAQCGQRAVLVITQSVVGTSTNVARSRTELICDQPTGHAGLHIDSRANETWQGKPGERPTLLRHEDGT